MNKEQFDAKKAQDAQKEQERKPPQSSMPPRSEWKSDSKLTSLNEVFKKQPAEQKELPPLWHSMPLPKGDKHAEERKREFFEKH